MVGDKANIRMTDDGGHFWLGGRLYKVKAYRTDAKSAMKGIHNAEYVEVDPDEYDRRVEELTSRIASFPGVDLKDVLRDALYDMTLDHLSRLEKKLDKEVARAEVASRPPKVETKRGERGTCVELIVGGLFGMQIRI